MVSKTLFCRKCKWFWVMLGGTIVNKVNRITSTLIGSPRPSLGKWVIHRQSDCKVDFFHHYYLEMLEDHFLLFVLLYFFASVQM